MVTAAAKQSGVRQVLIAGGVASSALFRELVRERIVKRDRGLHVCFGRPEFSGDNAVGAALIGADLLRKQETARD
jgi:N6-L-threonylcarbamoyladenine synthase